MNISILYEDDDLAVIDKPAGITVNNAETTKGETTIQDWASERFKIGKEAFDDRSGKKIEAKKFGE
jgi:23S rRNA-/tRNA-specific pseudouridylate synthase